MLRIGAMRTEDAIKEFGNSVRELAEALGITREAIYQWGEEVPPLRAYEIRDILEGRRAPKLGADDTPQSQSLSGTPQRLADTPPTTHQEAA